MADNSSHRESTAKLKAYASELGFELAGVCNAQSPPHLEQYKEWVAKGSHASMTYLEDHIPLKEHPAHLLPSVRSVLVVGLNYNQVNPYRSGYPRIARYALGRDYHKVIRGKLRKLQLWLEEQYPNSEHRACVDSAPIMERDFAQLAGLGWFGKNTMIINSKRGSWFLFGSLLSSVQFEADTVSTGGCGTCRACIDACPTGAIIHRNERWQVDASSCISYLTIESKGKIDEDLSQKIGHWTFGCDICQEVCPFNQTRDSQPERAKTTEVPDFLKRRDWPSLQELSVIQEDEWDRLTQGSPVRRAGLSGIRRNARINIENES